MHSQVVQLKRRSIPIAEAIRAYRSACYDDCLSALYENSSTQAQSLRIRALTRLGRMQDALDECPKHLDEHLSSVERGELHLLKVAALLRLGRLEEVEAELLEARVAAFSSCSPALEADYEFTEAVLCHSRRDLAGAAAGVDRALSVVSETPAWLVTDAPYFFSLGLVRARACDLRGLVVRAKEGLHAQLHWSRMALHEFDTDPREDDWVGSWFLSNFALLTVDAGDPGILEELCQRVATAQWAKGTQLQQFNVVRSVGWLRALAGDHLGAFREFRTSSELAPSRAWKLHSILDRSFLARELGQEMFAEEELNYAIELSDELDLEASRDFAPPFSALVKLAELAAARDASKGRAILDRYRAARSKCPPILFDGTDRAWQATELMAEASVARAEGREQLAIDLYVNALDAFDKLGSTWRAALAALELAEMTGQPFFLGYAGREASRRPQSWLARRLATLRPE